MSITSVNILNGLLHYRYFALFPLMVIGGPIVIVVSGSLVAAKILSFPIALMVIIAAEIVGDTAYYSIGRWGGLRLIKKWGHYVWLDGKKVNQLKSHFKNYGGRTLLFGKFTQFAGSVVLAAAGAAEMPYWRFFWFNLVATIPKTLFFIIIGFYSIEIYYKIHGYSEYLAIVFILFSILIILSYNLVSRKYFKTQHR